MTTQDIADMAWEIGTGLNRIGAGICEEQEDNQSVDTEQHPRDTQHPTSKTMRENIGQNPKT